MIEDGPRPRLYGRNRRGPPWAGASTSGVPIVNAEPVPISHYSVLKHIYLQEPSFTLQSLCLFIQSSDKVLESNAHPDESGKKKDAKVFDNGDADYLIGTSRMVVVKERDEPHKDSLHRPSLPLGKSETVDLCHHHERSKTKKEHFPKIV